MFQLLTAELSAVLLWSLWFGRRVAGGWRRYLFRPPGSV
jgi:hypothetical protein